MFLAEKQWRNGKTVKIRKVARSRTIVDVRV